VGLFNTGSAVGALLAPPLVAAIVLRSDWRMVFIVAGAIGLVWAIIWAWLYEPAASSGLVSDAERRYLREAGVGEVGPRQRVRWSELLKIRSVWILVVAKFLTDGAWFFFVFWLPKYLGDARGFEISAIGSYAWIPYAFAGVGSLVGGWFSGWLIRRGLSLNASRKTALGVSAALLPFSLLVVQAPVQWAILLVSLAFLGHQFWSVIVQTLPTDLFPAHAVGSVAGLIGCAGSFGAVLFNLLVGFLVDRFDSYSLPFLLGGILHPIAFVLVWLTLRVEPEPLPAR